MHKKYHKKFKILDILAVTTQAREGIETSLSTKLVSIIGVTTQAREGIDTVQSGVCLRQKKLYALLMSIQCLSPAKNKQKKDQGDNKKAIF